MNDQENSALVRQTLGRIEQQLRAVGVDVDSAVHYDVEEPQPRVGKELRKGKLIMRWYATERMTEATLSVTTVPDEVDYCATSFSVVPGDSMSGLWDRLTSADPGEEVPPVLARLCGGMKKWSGQSDEESEGLSWVATLGRGFQAHR